MAGIQVLCSKCGQPITITTEQIEEAQQTGIALNIVHERCPTEEDINRAYRVVIQVFKGEGADSELLSSVGGTAFAPTYIEAIPKIQNIVTEQWQRVVDLKDMIED